MPLRGLAKAKNFTLGPTAPMKTFTENIHLQTKESNNLRNSGKSHKLSNKIQNENLFRYESKIKSDFDEIVPTLKEIARIQHHEDFINQAQSISRKFGNRFTPPCIRQILGKTSRYESFICMVRFQTA